MQLGIARNPYRDLLVKARRHLKATGCTCHVEITIGTNADGQGGRIVCRHYDPCPHRLRAER